ncbi:hypothetical protein [Nostoc sphaeroides]|uniref:hypothetical protein n=1 Tax=Nostoc sphaeroides TaxID=446679 RepID=UPI001C709F85|nr:hypothetical protein [Nostoc sphaeroides]
MECSCDTNGNSSSKRNWSKSNALGVLVDNFMLNRRTRDRFALGVGGSYGQKDYWLGQLDPASPQEPLRFADSEPRVLKSWKNALTEKIGDCRLQIDCFWYKPSKKVGGINLKSSI